MMVRTPESIAEWFWAEAGISPTFPRDIERAVALALPVTVVSLARLGSHTIGEWFRRRRIQVTMPGCHDDLMGCVVAQSGHAFILVCGTDPDAERRFSIAHEVSHLLIHYFMPRLDLVEALGEEILEVLDGVRPPSVAERATAVLSSLKLGPHVHILPRTGHRSAQIARLEDEADRLAVELLAPLSFLRRGFRSRALQGLTDGERCELLADRFGLPASVLSTALGAGSDRRPFTFLDEAAGSLRGDQL